MEIEYEIMEDENISIEHFKNNKCYQHYSNKEKNSINEKFSKEGRSVTKIVSRAVVTLSQDSQKKRAYTAA